MSDTMAAVEDILGMPTKYEIVDVDPDTDEWLEERRKSIGASEVAAVLGMSKWATPRDVYLSKLGVDRDFDPELAFIGHQEEHTISAWIEKFRPELGKVAPGFMARSVQYPHLHASFDRMLVKDGRRSFVQMKTAHQYTDKDWADGVPVAIQVQVQTEILVGGLTGEYVVVFIGGRKFKVLWLPRDEDFINGYIVPRTKEFWDDVVDRVEPEPVTLSELYEVYPSASGSVVEGSEAVVEAAERRAVLLSDIQAQKDEADALTLAIGQYMKDAELLTDADGTPLLTYKTQQGKRGVTDLDRLETEHPEFVKRGNPFKVMRMSRRKAAPNV